MDKIEYKIKELPANFKKIAYLTLLLGFVLIVLSYLTDNARSSFNNILLLTLIASIGVGSLFMVSLEYVAGAVWSTPFRRVSEFLSSLILVLIFLAIPLFFNLHNIFHWTHTEAVAKDELLTHKSPYLNVSFLIIRFLSFIFLWLLFYFLITRNSVKQDVTADQKLTTKNIRLSAIFIPIFAITLTFFAIDWIMSLEPHWYSTIFGVYYFAGTILSAIATATYLIVILNERGYFQIPLVKDHYYSLGALLFAFINFWAYIAFSQYLLIWYANIPEETFWMLHRWEGSWKFLSIGLIIVHFVVPYVVLLSQPSKMDPKRLKFISLWILFAHYV
ncbi:MAG: quinol:cytochrome C oxidoreductase, partial [Ignavibacteria bacterium]|nr:quinol:cytochrome C oxidoreductase [Ignavibacteria bacterium]